MEAKIRPVKEKDLQTLADFEAEISRISFGDEAITDEGFHIKKLRKAMEKDAGGMFVLETGGAVSGWLWMDIKTNFLTNEPYVNFRSFYLSDELRGGGAGQKLLEHGLDICRKRGARSITGKVHVSNLPMRALYKNAGFDATHITMELTL